MRTFKIWTDRDDLYRRINVDARRLDEIYADSLSLDQRSKATWRCSYLNAPVSASKLRAAGRDDPVTLTALHAVASDLFAQTITTAMQSDRYLDPARFLTLGCWARR